MKHSAHAERDNGRANSNAFNVHQHLFLDAPGVRIAGKFDAIILAVLFENTLQHGKGCSLKFASVKLTRKAKQRHYIFVKPAMLKGHSTFCIDAVFDFVGDIIYFSIEPTL